MSKRRIPVLLLAVGLVATGCGPSKVKLVVDSIDALKKKGSAKVAMSVNFSFESAGQDFSFEMTGDGGMQFDPARAGLKFSFPQGSEMGLAESQEFRQDGDFAYLTAPPCPTGALGDRPWIKYNAVKAAGVDPSSVSSNDPTNLMESLRGASKVEKAGKEDVHGASATKYEVTIDLDKALKAMSEERRKAVQSIFESMKKQTKAQVWIDNAGVLHQFRLNFSGGNASEGTFKMTMTMGFHDHGSEITVEIPPEDQVTTVEGPQALAQMCLQQGQ